MAIIKTKPKQLYRASVCVIYLHSLLKLADQQNDNALVFVSARHRFNLRYLSGVTKFYGENIKQLKFQTRLL